MVSPSAPMFTPTHTKALAPLLGEGLPLEKTTVSGTKPAIGTKPRSTPPTGGTWLRQAVFQRNASQTNVSQTNAIGRTGPANP